MRKIVLAYSGDLATSVAIAWLAGHQSAEVATVTLDVGGAASDEIRDRALAIGAARAHVIDARDEFANDFVLPSLQAGALDDDRSPMASALARPLIAKHLVAIARIEGTSTIAHAGLPYGGREARITTAARALEPGVKVADVTRIRDFTRAEMIEYAKQRGIPVPASAGVLRSTDANLWGRTSAGGVLDDLSMEAPEDLFSATKPASETPDTPAYVELHFDRGVPTQINQVPMPLVELIQSLATIAGAHGVGRLEAIESSGDSARSRRIHEAPAALALHVAHRELQRLVTSSDLDRLAASIAREYAGLIRDGGWYSTKRSALDALVAHVQQTVTGVIRLKLYKGRCEVVGRWAGNALAAGARAVLETSGAVS